MQFATMCCGCVLPHNHAPERPVMGRGQELGGVARQHGPELGGAARLGGGAITNPHPTLVWQEGPFGRSFL
jgi:hypothetical protein